MKNCGNLIIIGAVVIAILIYGATRPTPYEKNALLDQMKFSQMNTEQKTEVLEKIILGKVNPYNDEHLIVTQRLNRGLDISKDFILWNGKIVDADNGLIAAETYGNRVEPQEFGIIYLGKGLISLCTKPVLDSLSIALRPKYESKYSTGSPQQRLNELKSNFRGSGSIKSARCRNGKVSIEYVSNYAEYKRLQPQSLLTEKEWHNYWSTGSAIDKALVQVSGLVLKEMDDVREVYVLIPYNGRKRTVRLSKSKLEKYAGKDMELLRKGWKKYYEEQYLFNPKGRKKFLRFF